MQAWTLTLAAMLAGFAAEGGKGTAAAPDRILARSLAGALRRGWEPAPYPEEPPLRPSPADRDRGFVLFQRNVNLRVYPRTTPRPGELDGVVRCFGARGETVSVQVALRTLRRLDGVRVRLGKLTGPRGSRAMPAPPASRPAAAPISPGNIRCRWVEYAPIRSRGRRRRGRNRTSRADRANRTRRTCRVVPLRIRSMPAGGLDLPADWTQAFWLTVRIPADQPPGRYEGTLEVLGGGRTLARVPFVMTVLPLRLEKPRSMFFGAFLMLSGPPDGPDVHNEAQLRDLAERGIHGILWFWGHYGLAVRRVNDRLRLDFTLIDAFMERVKRAGLEGPVVLALGNDSHAHLEEAIGLLWNLPLRRTPRNAKRAPDHLFVVGEPDSARMDALYVEALRQLLDHARRRDWPEIVLLPYDEPTERLKEEYLHRAGLIRKHFPEVRIYGVVMNDSWALPWLGPASDILVANGDLGAVRAYAAGHGKAFWTYGGRCQAAYSFGRARIDYGLRPWAAGSQGHWFWAYNWRIGDPLDEFDGERGDAGWVVAYPPERPDGPCVPSPAFEGMRAGVDDFRYLEALQRLLARLPARSADKFRERLDDLRTDVRRYRGLVGAEKPAPPEVPFPTGPVSGYDAYRLRLAAMALEARGALRGR